MWNSKMGGFQYKNLTLEFPSNPPVMPQQGVVGLNIDKCTLCPMCLA